MLAKTGRSAADTISPLCTQRVHGNPAASGCWSMPARMPNFCDHIGLDCAGRSIELTARIEEFICERLTAAALWAFASCAAHGVMALPPDHLTVTQRH